MRTHIPEISYKEQELTPEAIARLEQAYDLLFEIVFADELKDIL